MRISDWSSDVCSSDLSAGRSLGGSLKDAPMIAPNPTRRAALATPSRKRRRTRRLGRLLCAVLGRIRWTGAAPNDCHPAEATCIVSPTVDPPPPRRSSDPFLRLERTSASRDALSIRSLGGVNVLDPLSGDRKRGGWGRGW